MGRALIFLLIAALAAPTLAQSPTMNAEEFRAATEGYTLYFEDEQGEYFGAETYMENGQTMWLPRDGQCIPGVWRQSEDRICFLHYQEVACWRIYGDESGAELAVSADQGGLPLTLRIFRRDKSPVLCPDGPGV